MQGQRRRYLWPALLMTLSCAEEAPDPSRSLRHAILITVDTLRPDRIGAYGYGRADSPHLDALASESIRFEYAYAHSSMTAPSFASLLTGSLPSRHRIFDNGGNLGKKAPTVTTWLHGAGFVTGAFLGNYALRPNRGFDRGFAIGLSNPKSIGYQSGVGCRLIFGEYPKERIASAGFSYLIFDSL